MYLLFNLLSFLILDLYQLIMFIYIYNIYQSYNLYYIMDFNQTYQHNINLIIQINYYLLSQKVIYKSFITMSITHRINKYMYLLYFITFYHYYHLFINHIRLFHQFIIYITLIMLIINVFQHHYFHHLLITLFSYNYLQCLHLILI